MDTPEQASPAVIEMPLEVLKSLTKETPPCLPKYRLSVPALAILLPKKSQKEIAAIFNITESAVSQYVSSHADELEDLKSFDSRITSKIKEQVHKVVDSLNSHDLKKEGLIAKNAFIGTMIEKIRLIEGKSTQNISTLTRLVQACDPLDTPQDMGKMGDKDG